MPHANAGWHQSGMPATLYCWCATQGHSGMTATQVSCLRRPWNIIPLRKVLLNCLIEEYINNDQERRGSWADDLKIERAKRTVSVLLAPLLWYFSLSFSLTSTSGDWVRVNYCWAYKYVTSFWNYEFESSECCCPVLNWWPSSIVYHVNTTGILQLERGIVNCERVSQPTTNTQNNIHSQEEIILTSSLPSSQSDTYF